jgi:hypothetical protein
MSCLADCDQHAADDERYSIGHRELIAQLGLIEEAFLTDCVSKNRLLSNGTQLPFKRM